MAKKAKQNASLDALGTVAIEGLLPVDLMQRPASLGAQTRNGSSSGAGAADPPPSASVWLAGSAGPGAVSSRKCNHTQRL